MSKKKPDAAELRAAADEQRRYAAMRTKHTPIGTMRACACGKLIWSRYATCPDCLEWMAEEMERGSK